MTTEINPQIIRWFESRGIDGETVVRMGIYSGRRQANGDDAGVVPAADGNIIVFPYGTDGAKYRAAGKRFWQKPGCRKTFFNEEVLKDPAVTSGKHPLVITEGEMDALSLIACGYPFAVSVPDGAPPERDGKGKIIAVPEDASDVDPEADEKYSYVFNNWGDLAAVKHIILMTDGDGPGKRLAAELVRRLGRVRCSFVTYPEGCKDANEVLLNRGPGDLLNMVTTARPYPVSGVYTYSDLPPEPDLNPVTTGWGMLDRHLKLYKPALMVVTGFAGQGKSTWVQQLVAQVAKIHGWTTALASFEMRLKPFVTDHLGAVFMEMPRSQWTLDHYRQVDQFLEDHFCFIEPEPSCDRNHDLDWLLEKAEAAVIRHGASIIVIDPWNEIEHSRNRDESMTDYVGRALRQIKDFGRRFDCLMIIVAHPTKGAAVNKEPEELTLYDISDSPHFQNKADIGVVIGRLGDNPAVDTLTGVYVKKIRYQPTIGIPGFIQINFDKDERMFGQ